MGISLHFLSGDLFKTLVKIPYKKEKAAFGCKHRFNDAIKVLSYSTDKMFKGGRIYSQEGGR